MAAYGLYTHIQSNRRRSVFLLVGLFFLVYVMVYAGALAAEGLFNGQAPLDWLIAQAWRDFLVSWPWATVGTGVWMLIAYRFNQAIIDSVTGGREISRRESPRIYNLLENLCISRGIPMPKLKIMESTALNAFASGLNQKQYSITVTSALVNRLDDAELEAVLGHELTHIRNGDVRMMVVAMIIAGIIGFVAELVFRAMFYGRWTGGRRSGGDRGKGGGGAAILIAVGLVIVAWVLSLVIRFALSRSREYLADAGSVELTKNPDAMITALRKIENRGELEGVTSAVMEMCVDNPRSGFADLFATHPPIEKRIAALVENAGGHDPGPIAQLPDASEPPAFEQPATPEVGPWGAVEPPQNAPIPGAAEPPGTIGDTIGPWGPRPGGR